MNLLNKIKNITRDQLLKIFTVTVALIIILDMDQYLYEFLNSYNLPLPSTILTYLWLPLFVILVFLILEPNKKRVFMITVIIGIIYIVYFIIHHYITKDLATTLYLTNNFYYSLKYELIYMFILIIPFGFIYAVYRINPTFDQVQSIMVMAAMIIAIPIVLGNIFTFSPSTYVGWTKANFFTWFTGIYDTYLPRELATKFFFSEGNTTGTVLFMTFPFTLNFMNRRKADWKGIITVIIQGMAMYCIATRVATYGVLILMVVYLVILIFIFVIHRVRINLKFLLIYLTIFLAFLSMFKFTPAYVNQQLNTENNGFLLDNESLRQEIKGTIGKPNLTPYSAEYINYYVHIFVDNAFLLSIPETYYKDLYDYHIDPKFWVDLIFEYDFYQRADGRAFEKIFSDYEWNKLNTVQKLFGFSYSTYMTGGILLEQDFAMQFYTHGYIGFCILCAPWLAILLIIIILALKRFKYIVSIDILVCGVALCGGLVCAYASGHTLDETFSSILLATLMAELLILVNKNKKEMSNND